MEVKLPTDGLFQAINEASFNTYTLCQEQIQSSLHTMFGMHREMVILTFHLIEKKTCAKSTIQT